MNIKKVIFFVESFFTDRDYYRFGMQTFIDNGLEVEVWDFTPFLTSNSYQKASHPGISTWKQRRIFSTKREAISAIAELIPSCFVVSLIHYNYDTFPLYRMLTKRRIRYCIQAFALPISSTPREVAKKNIKKISNVFKPHKLMRKIFQMIPFEWLGIRPADIILATAGKYITSGFAVNKKSEILWVHSFDYDVFLQERSCDTAVDPKVGVFIDEYLPFHPDYINAEVDPPITPEEYYPLLRRCFDYLEEKNGVRIVIAAHPRSEYEKHPDYFGGREVIRGKTDELIRKAGFVLMHHSMASNFAVLYKKPIIFLTTSKLDNRLCEDPSVEWLGAFFRKKVHNLDKTLAIDLDDELKIDEKVYNAYRNAYIKKDSSEDLLSWQILINRIKSIV
jgi:hypothetical protein